jgi:hypothetical protein
MHKQYFQKSAVVHCILMNLGRTIENGRFELLVIVPSSGATAEDPDPLETALLLYLKWYDECHDTPDRFNLLLP